ncbi:unnamed protein product [Symbiodinium microadriaticum]|nr:unnamed protein product [Symbiodinium microadriaticum]CAE7319416.1 unnamed protein product [Symbiodinium sp. KB8]
MQVGSGVPPALMIRLLRCWGWRAKRLTTFLAWPSPDLLVLTWAMNALAAVVVAVVAVEPSGRTQSRLRGIPGPETRTIGVGGCTLHPLLRHRYAGSGGVQATLLEPDPVKLEERVEMLQGIVRRAPSSLLYDLAEAFGRAGVDIGKCESWTDTGFAFLRANVETVRPPDIWCAKWYNYTFLHGCLHPAREHGPAVFVGDQDYPSYAFYARVVQSELEQWAVKSLCKKIMTIGKGQQGALILGVMRSPMQHSKMQAGGTTVEQHAARHAYIVRGVDGRFAVRSDYAVPTAVIVYWPE